MTPRDRLSCPRVTSRGELAQFAACPDRLVPRRRRGGHQPPRPHVRRPGGQHGRLHRRGHHQAAGQLTARATPHPLSAAPGPAPRVLSRHHPRSPASGTSRCARPGHPAPAPGNQGNYDRDRATRTSHHLIEPAQDGNRTQRRKRLAWCPCQHRGASCGTGSARALTTPARGAGMDGEMTPGTALEDVWT
jgi:hypothetical protein